jgi:AbrB family looped-hinge helix DNA binding protein
MSTKGQVVLPKAVREAVGWKPGEVLEAQATAEGEVVLVRVQGTQIERLRGMFADEGGHNMLDELLAERRAEAARDCEGLTGYSDEEKALYNAKGPYELKVGSEAYFDELKRHFWRDGPDPPGYDIDENGKRYRVT